MIYLRKVGVFILDTHSQSEFSPFFISNICTQTYFENDAQAISHSFAEKREMSKAPLQKVISTHLIS